MAGHMGNRVRTVQNLLVMRIDTIDDLIFLKGCLAGPPGSFVRVSDAIKKCLSRGRERLRQTELGLSQSEQRGIGNGVNSLPFPTVTRSMVEQLGLPKTILYQNERK